MRGVELASLGRCRDGDSVSGNVWETCGCAWRHSSGAADDPMSSVTAARALRMRIRLEFHGARQGAAWGELQRDAPAQAWRHGSGAALAGGRAWKTSGVAVRHAECDIPQVVLV